MNKIIQFILLFGAQFCFGQWEALEGPYGGRLNGAVQSENSLFVFNSYGAIFRSTDKGTTWSLNFSKNDSFQLSKMIYTIDKKLYSVYSNIYSGNNFIFLSSDEGKNWDFIKYLSFSDFQGTIFITDNYYYSIKDSLISYCGINDTIIKYFKLTNKNAKEVFVNNKDYIYYTDNRTVYRSEDFGINFDELLQTEHLYLFDTDREDNLFVMDCYTVNDSNYKYRVNISIDQGSSWQKYDIPSELHFNRWQVVDKENFYIWTLGDSLWIMEKIDTNLKARYLGIKSNSDSAFIQGILSTKDYLIVTKSNFLNYISEDKYLTNLNEIKSVFQIVYELVGGTKLLLAQGYSLSYLENNKIKIFEKYKVASGGSWLFASNKDYFWFSRMGSGPLETYYSTDMGKSLKMVIDYRKSSTYKAENSKGEIFGISWAKNLEKSVDQINWEIFYKIEYSYPRKILIDKNDDILIFDYKTDKPFEPKKNDTISIKKFNGLSLDSIFSKEFLIPGRFINAVITPNFLIYALFENELLLSSNEGTSWDVVLDGVSRNLIFRDIISINKTIHVATNKGVLTSDDNGVTWYDNNEGLRTYDCYSLGKTADNTLYVGLAYDVVYRNTKMTKVQDVGKIEPALFLSPNPATDFLEISFSPSIKRWLGGVSEQNIEIFSVMGEKLKQIENGELKMENDKIIIDISTLSTGLYFLKVGEKVEKFVKL